MIDGFNQTDRMMMFDKAKKMRGEIKKNE